MEKKSYKMSSFNILKFNQCYWKLVHTLRKRLCCHQETQNTPAANRPLACGTGCVTRVDVRWTTRMTPPIPCIHSSQSLYFRMCCNVIWAKPCIWRGGVGCPDDFVNHMLLLSLYREQDTVTPIGYRHIEIYIGSAPESVQMIPS